MASEASCRMPRFITRRAGDGGWRVQPARQQSSVIVAGSGTDSWTASVRREAEQLVPAGGRMGMPSQNRNSSSSVGPQYATTTSTLPVTQASVTLVKPKAGSVGLMRIERRERVEGHQVHARQLAQRRQLLRQRAH